MKIRLSFLCLIGLILAACASAPRGGPAGTSEASWITPHQAVLLAADAAPAGADGTFSLTVRGTGSQRGQLFLNSELDYRDQRTLTVAISPVAAQQLSQRYGQDPLVYLKGRDILVSGAAVRTKVYFFVNGRMTDKYYYQTHVNVSNASQITVR